MNKEIKIEICLDSVESVIIAERAGADRVELCSDLFEGGLTPTVGTFLLAKEKTDIPVNVMIRPRGGDFCYSDLEFEVMMREARLMAVIRALVSPSSLMSLLRGMAWR